MKYVGIRELKSRLSYFLQLIAKGEDLIVTHRGNPIARLTPPNSSETLPQAQKLIQTGQASWAGGKPRGLAAPPSLNKGTISRMVIENRR